MHNSSSVFSHLAATTESAGAFDMPKITTKEGFKINYEVHGSPSAEQTIVLCHGNGNCLNDWKSLGYVERLAPHFRLVLMDALGYGESDKPHDASQYTPERRAADVISVLDALGIDKVHFFGNSVGGSLGFVLADIYPNRFLSFTIGSAHPYGSTEPVGCNLFPEVFRKQLITEGTEKFVADLEEQFLKRRFHEGVRERYIHNDPVALALANTPIWPDRSARLPSISVPVLLFAGTLDPVSELLPKFAGALPKCDMRALEGVDHCDAYWDSSTVAPLVRDFIMKHFPSPSAAPGM